MTLIEAIEAIKGTDKTFRIRNTNVNFKIYGKTLYRQISDYDTKWETTAICDAEFLVKDIFEINKTKKEGWVNIYPNSCVRQYTIYKTKEDADKHTYTDRVACVKIEWVE